MDVCMSPPPQEQNRKGKSAALPRNFSRILSNRKVYDHRVQFVLPFESSLKTAPISLA